MSGRSRTSFPTLSLGLSLVLAVLGSAMSPAARASIVVSGSFGPNGDLGFVNSPPSLAITSAVTARARSFKWTDSSTWPV